MPVPGIDRTGIHPVTTRGRFISLEGIDGAGKSTHAAWIKEALLARGRTVVATREPGGTSLGEALRGLLLAHPMTHDTEALLMFAVRREHVEQVIAPALARGDWVLCDRFTDATFAYQGGGHGVPRERIEELERFIPANCRPELTILFDVPIEVSRERLERGVAHPRLAHVATDETVPRIDGDLPPGVDAPGGERGAGPRDVRLGTGETIDPVDHRRAPGERREREEALHG